jgi:hypothetical protein
MLVGGSSGTFDTPANQVSPRSGLGVTASADRLSPTGGRSISPSRSQEVAWAAARAGRARRRFGSTQSTLCSAASGANATALDARGAGGGGGNRPILEGVRITADAARAHPLRAG